MVGDICCAIEAAVFGELTSVFKIFVALLSKSYGSYLDLTGVSDEDLEDIEDHELDLEDSADILVFCS